MEQEDVGRGACCTSEQRVEFQLSGVGVQAPTIPYEHVWVIRLRVWLETLKQLVQVTGESMAGQGERTS